MAALEVVDAFVGGLLGGLTDDALVVIASDHGNIEDVTAGHTRNPVLGMLMGQGASDRAVGLESIRDIPCAVIEWLGEVSDR